MAQAPQGVQARTVKTLPMIQESRLLGESGEVLFFSVWDGNGMTAWSTTANVICASAGEDRAPTLRRPVLISNLSRPRRRQHGLFGSFCIQRTTNKTTSLHFRASNFDLFCSSPPPPPPVLSRYSVPARAAEWE
ncbi:hypothetical protein BB8028_0004g03350 [Beauveria bassiana]|uniref:Uncharacterized protein n=1 Tax=Beauveria bassiana TaxID=176275 RepID=A0A2S7YBK7_BEABA|nr:hypothetical protein BB8028_0004g03350 [Beauveria bassiana]